MTDGIIALPEELLRLGIFLVAVGSIFGLCAATLGKRLFAAARGLPPERLTRARKTILALGGMGVLCILYGRFVEPFWPEIVTIRLESAKLAKGAGPIRLVLISDLHCDPSPRLEERLPSMIAGLRPHAIVFAGDALNSERGLPIFRELMGKLARIAPTYAVWGNYDSIFRPDLERYEGTGVKMLGERAEKIGTAKGERIWLAGVNYGKEQMMEKNLHLAPAHEPRALVYHLPDLALDAARLGADLYLAGHTHGGQVAMPFYGALITLSKFGKRFEAGLYKEGTTWIYVNRGIGMEGGSAPRVRFLARPEITLIELKNRTPPTPDDASPTSPRGRPRSPRSI